jgi:hypothetical protein
MESGLKPGDLIQLNKNVFGGGDIGMVLGPHPRGDGCLEVLFHDGRRQVHPSNVQKLSGGSHESR